MEPINDNYNGFGVGGIFSQHILSHLQHDAKKIEFKTRSVFQDNDHIYNDMPIGVTDIHYYFKNNKSCVYPKFLGVFLPGDIFYRPRYFACDIWSVYPCNVWQTTRKKQTLLCYILFPIGIMRDICIL